MRDHAIGAARVRYTRREGEGEERKVVFKPEGDPRDPKEGDHRGLRAQVSSLVGKTEGGKNIPRDSTGKSIQLIN